MPITTFLKTKPSGLDARKRRYLQELNAPLDGMWLSFVDAADHYAISTTDEIVGYCVVDSDHRLLQFVVDVEQGADDIFLHALAELNVKRVVVASCQPVFQGLCERNSSAPSRKIALMYCVDQNHGVEPFRFPKGAEIRLVTMGELEFAIEFTMDAIGADKNWLAEYYKQRITQKELFGLWQAGKLVATGECRLSKLQPHYADVGMIVSQAHRGQGVATNVLRWLIAHCAQRGLQAICSTESKNIAAQKAIERAGFINYHRILEFTILADEPRSGI